MLTGLALFASAVIGLGYAFSQFDRNWLLMVVAVYFVHWFGDSLDGSIARFRKIERPSFGFFIDHSCDVFAILLMLAGMGLSPYVRMDIALFAVAAYLLLAIHSFLMAKVVGEMPLSQAGAGPTEMRLLLITLTLIMYFMGPGAGQVGPFSGLDIFVGGFATIMVIIFVTQTLRVGARLREQDTLK